MSMIDMYRNLELTKVIKFAGNYFENGDIVKIAFKDGKSEVGELQIDNELDSISIKTIDNMYMTFVFDSDFFSIEKASDIEVFMWKLEKDSELQKKLTGVITQRIEKKNRLEKQIQELQEQL